MEFAADSTNWFWLVIFWQVREQEKIWFDLALSETFLKVPNQKTSEWWFINIWHHLNGMSTPLKKRFSNIISKSIFKQYFLNTSNINYFLIPSPEDRGIWDIGKLSTH